MSELDIFTAAGDGLAVEHFGLAEDGRAFVVAGPFAKAMGYRDAANAVRVLDEDEKGTQIVSTPGGDQRVSVIFEDGIWELIFRSTLPSAKTLKSRVKAILRQLRETGVVDTRERPMSELEMAERYVAALRRNAELEPAAHAWNTLASGEGDLDVAGAAKILSRDPSIKTGRDRLFDYMHRQGWLFRNGHGRWEAYQDQIENGRLASIPKKHKHPRTGEIVIDPPQVRVTVKGLQELHKRLGGSGPLLLAA
ncbi:phage antirepressor KilAC domain-containing protein [Amycolatopsis rubida]|uniref:Prophage antirepressor n=1 Tax=Amycolatopsis rubida TaxID=112413 RepID=A0A1I5IK10_9PSEU|nr:phage antirepressor KilAC domain-containing protein [Amycolatopsis rubida]SFO60792.1 Prophage antirepressor [Amycolatopsis rubida]